MVLDYAGLQAILNQFPTGVLFANAKGEIPLCNERALDLLGLEALDVMAQGVGAFPPDSGLAGAMASLERAERQRETLSIRRGRRWLTANLVKGGIALFDEPCVLILVTDATEQRRLEEFQRSCQDEFLHRLRGSLTSVKTSLSFLDSGVLAALPDPVREIIALGHAEVQRLHSLVQQMGELLALESQAAEGDLYLESVGLEDFLAKFLRRYRKNPAAQNREIRLENEGRIPFQVVVDYDKLGSMLGNLLSNALAHSPRETPVAISVAAAGAMAEIRVRDQGPGIPASERERVFDKFYRPRGAGSAGGGLGLFLARGYAELMRGQLELDSAEGRGTTAILRLPLSRDAGWTETQSPA